MVTTLFGYLVHRLSPQPENLATEAFAYVLGESPTAKNAFIDLIRNRVRELPGDLEFRTQVVGEGKEVPDLVGMDALGHEVLITEAKFWAGLTDNQPVAYLRRLPNDRPAALLFLCPQLRVKTLWAELLQRCTDAGLIPTKLEESGTMLHARFHDSRRLVLTSWPAVLSILDTQLGAKGDDQTRGDLHQLDGLCQLMDSDAFLPITPEDFAPAIPKRIRQYFDLIDDVVSQLEREGLACTKGMLKPGRVDGYRRYMLIRGNGCYVGLRWRLWATERETPFWLRIQDQNWKTTPELRKALSPLEGEKPPRLIANEGKLYVPLSLPIGKERNAVLLEVANQVRRVAGLLPDHTSDLAKLPVPE
jgi:hypothetical protein